jgi:hypothetical protein
MASSRIIIIRCKRFRYSKPWLFKWVTFLENYAGVKTVIHKVEIVWEKWGNGIQTQNFMVCKLMINECENICVHVHGSCVSIPD